MRLVTLKFKFIVNEVTDDDMKDLPVLPTYEYEGDPFEAITLPVPRNELNNWLYWKAYEHAQKHFESSPGAFYGDLRAFLGKELEFMADALGCVLPQPEANLHTAWLELADNEVTSAYIDVFGEDVYG